MSKWPEVALGDIFDIARGGSPRPIDDYITDADDGVNWISISDASDSEKFITKTKKKIIKEGVTRSRLVKSGDFLLTNSMSFGRPYIMATDGCIHDGWLVLSKKIDNVDQDYFFHLLGSESTYRKFKSLAAGAVVKNLNIDLVKSVTVPLPPLEEQKRIAAILDKADSLRRKRAQAIALADDFLRATFLDMFGDKPKNNTLGDMCDIITGFAFQSQNYSLSQDDVRLVRGVNVGIGAVDWSDAAYYPIGMVGDLNRFMLAENDVVLAMDRPWISSGLKCARVTKSEAGAYLVQRVARMRSDVACSEFILQNLMDPTFKQHCRITETTIPHISPKDLQTFPIPSVSKTELAKFELIAQRLRFQAAVAKDSKLVMTDLQRSLDRLI